jgi:hypothetical protein
MMDLVTGGACDSGLPDSCLRGGSFSQCGDGRHHREVRTTNARIPNSASFAERAVSGSGTELRPWWGARIARGEDGLVRIAIVGPDGPALRALSLPRGPRRRAHACRGATSCAQRRPQARRGRFSRLGADGRQALHRRDPRRGGRAASEALGAEAASAGLRHCPDDGGSDGWLPNALGRWALRPGHLDREPLMTTESADARLDPRGIDRRCRVHFAEKDRGDRFPPSARSRERGRRSRWHQHALSDRLPLCVTGIEEPRGARRELHGELLFYPGFRGVLHTVWSRPGPRPPCQLGPPRRRTSAGRPRADVHVPRDARAARRAPPTAASIADAYGAMAREDRLTWATADDVAGAARAFLDPVLAGEPTGTWDNADLRLGSRPDRVPRTSRARSQRGASYVSGRRRDRWPVGPEARRGRVRPCGREAQTARRRVPSPPRDSRRPSAAARRALSHAMRKRRGNAMRQ